jgi:hypothetical protein
MLNVIRLRKKVKKRSPFSQSLLKKTFLTAGRSQAKAGNRLI